MSLTNHAKGWIYTPLSQQSGPIRIQWIKGQSQVIIPAASHFLLCHFHQFPYNHPSVAPRRQDVHRTTPSHSLHVPHHAGSRNCIHPEIIQTLTPTDTKAAHSKVTSNDKKIKNKNKNKNLLNSLPFLHNSTRCFRGKTKKRETHL